MEKWGEEIQKASRAVGYSERNSAVARAALRLLAPWILQREANYGVVNECLTERLAYVLQFCEDPKTRKLRTWCTQHGVPLADGQALLASLKDDNDDDKK